MDSAVQQQFDELRAEVAALRWREACRQRRGNWQWRATALIVAALMAMVPLSLLAHDRFSDVPDQAQYSHHDNINLIAQAGITVGCGGDPTVYCPNDIVTRGEMATFLARTAGLGSNPPIARASFAQTAAKASEADALNGLMASDMLSAALGGGFTYLSTSDPSGDQYKTIGKVGLIATTRGFVVATGTVVLSALDVHYNGEQCPCQVMAILQDLTTPFGGGSSSGGVVGQIERADGSTTTITVTWIFPIRTPGLHEFALQVRHVRYGEVAAFPNTAGMSADAQITTIFVPFDGVGNSSP